MARNNHRYPSLLSVILRQYIALDRKMARNNHHYTTHFKDGLRVRRSEPRRADANLRREIEEALLELEVFDDGLGAYLDEEEDEDGQSDVEVDELDYDWVLDDDGSDDGLLLDLCLDDEEEGDDPDEVELWFELDEFMLWTPIYALTAPFRT